MTPQIKGLLPSSLIEWEGRISVVVFLPVCNYRCPNCHVPDLVRPSPESENIPVESLRDVLLANEGWIDGVVITGGEPCVHGEDLIGFIEMLRDWTPGIRLATNGSRPEVLRRLIDSELIESVGMDVKQRLVPEHYARATGTAADVGRIRTSMDMLKESQLECEFRTTVVPGIHSVEDIEEIAATLGPDTDYVLQGFRPGNCLDPAMNKVGATSTEELEKMLRAATPHVGCCRIRGVSAATCEVET